MSEVKAGTEAQSSVSVSQALGMKPQESCLTDENVLLDNSGEENPNFSTSLLDFTLPACLPACRSLGFYSFFSLSRCLPRPASAHLSSFLLMTSQLLKSNGKKPFKAPPGLTMLGNGASRAPGCSWENSGRREEGKKKTSAKLITRTKLI